MLSPLVRVNLFGLLCPCLESDETRAARLAIGDLQRSVPITWLRPTTTTTASSATAGGTNTNAVGSFVSSWFTKGMGPGGSTAPSSSSSSSSSWNKIESQLSVIDHATFGPSVQITPQTTPSDDGGGGEITMKRSGGYIRIIPFRKMTRVSTAEGCAADDNFLTGMVRAAAAAAASSSGEGGGGKKKKSVVIFGKHSKSSAVSSEDDDEEEEEELIRFDVVNGEATRREEIVQHIKILIEWDRKRRAAAAAAGGTDDDQEEFQDGDEEARQDDYDDHHHHDDDNEEEEEEETGNKTQSTRTKRAMQAGGIKGRAAMAAYFARKEIEMQQRKREREKKKARYLQDSGGLKYTAVAMANRGGG